MIAVVVIAICALLGAGAALIEKRLRK